jgi:hypothetical protein
VISYTTLNFLLALMLLIWFWRDSLQVREIATRIGRKSCQSYGVQFLDQTVALHRLSLRWVRSGLKLRRTYQFDYSLEGEGRRTGYLVMMGNQHVSLHLDLPKEKTDEDQQSET